MLRLSKKWSYALKSVIYIAKNKNQNLKIVDLSKNLWISESLLRRLISNLEKTWIITTIKWRYWWIKLWKNISDISVYDILFSVWEDLWITDCTKGIDCDNLSSCLTSNLLINLQKSFNWILKLQTLDKILKK